MNNKTLAQHTKVLGPKGFVLTLKHYAPAKKYFELTVLNGDFIADIYRYLL